MILIPRRFVQEQLDFDNSIAACNKAVEILHGHFGDGTPKESTRPAWMSFMQELSKVSAGLAHGSTSRRRRAEQFL